MKRGSLSATLGMASLVIVALIVLLAGSRDKDGPEIKFSENSITEYKDDMDVSTLLNGVVAMDEKDGDVTSTVRIQNIVILKDEGRIIVSYSAKDSSNNVSTVNKSITYNGTQDYIDYSILDESLFGKEESGDESNSESSSKEVESSSENTSSQTTTPEATTPEETTPEETTPEETTPEETTVSQEDFNSTPIDRAEVDRTGVPQIRMKYKTHTIPVGGDFYFMDALAEWYDDKDDVSRRVILIGEYDLNVPGSYTLTYYVTDSDLNVSNRETITLIVE